LKADPRDVRTGALYIDGDVAAAEGAIAAGCKFLGGYPITPSTEAAEAFAKRAPHVGAIFIQMEDELGSISAVMGASLSGRKSMTITSGPGFSLMMETIGFGAMLEIPFVIINIQRGGPSTGVPTRTGQADMMQARWGSHGDYEVITLSPDSPQESFDFGVKCFNLAEKYRCPVMLMSDECVGHMTEKVVIPEADKIYVEPRRLYTGSKDSYAPFKPDKDLVPPLVNAGEGYKQYLTALAHNEMGHPAEDIQSTRERLVEKIRKNAPDIIDIREEGLDDAEVVVVSYGITSRVAYRAIDLARKEGIKVGNLRLVTVWPFPDDKITELSKKVKGFIVPEINYGQVVFEVERCVHGNADVVLVPHGGAWVHNPDDILGAIKKVAKGKKRLEGVFEYKTELDRLIFGSGAKKK
jgi:2-oxoglutarate ferredoxin oxidoreductase subunit alpha